MAIMEWLTQPILKIPRIIWIIIFIADLLIIDPIPFIDELIFLGLSVAPQL